MVEKKAFCNDFNTIKRNHSLKTFLTQHIISVTLGRSTLLSKIQILCYIHIIFFQKVIIYDLPRQHIICGICNFKNMLCKIKMCLPTPQNCSSVM